MACLKGADKFSILRNFTDKVKWDNTDEIVRMCANLTKNDTLFALGRGGVCLSGKNMTVTYNADDTKNATCNHGIGMGDSMFVYSSGKHCRSISKKRLASGAHYPEPPSPILLNPVSQPFSVSFYSALVGVFIMSTTLLLHPS